MKNLLIILLLIVWTQNHAQTIKSLYDDEYGYINGAYYKDTHDDLTRYVGTWKYTTGNTSLTISLQKKVMQEAHDATYNYNYFADMLIGEYKYIENGVEKVNTLPQLSLVLADIIEYNIVGNAIIGPNSYYCNDCAPNDRKILLQFSEPDRSIPGYEPEMIFERADEGSIQKLKLKFRSTSSRIVEEGIQPQFSEYSIPFGEYILVKQ